MTDQGDEIERALNGNLSDDEVWALDMESKVERLLKDDKLIKTVALGLGASVLVIGATQLLVTKAVAKLGQGLGQINANQIAMANALGPTMPPPVSVDSKGVATVPEHSPIHDGVDVEGPVIHQTTERYVDPIPEGQTVAEPASGPASEPSEEQKRLMASEGTLPAQLLSNPPTQEELKSGHYDPLSVPIPET